MVPTVLGNPGISWNLNFVLECPRLEFGRI